jgi:hypothetical protein
MPWITARGLGALFVNQLNGFQSADFLVANGDNSGILIYGWFIFALAGFIIGVLLLMKKNVPVFIDWLIAIVCIVGSLVFINLNSGSKVVIQTGLYATLVGSIAALVFQIISVIKKET